jgi:hypothetical protein
MAVASDWLDEMVLWLEGFPWLLFCTFTFRPGFSEAEARWRLLLWIDQLREALGTPDFEWFGVPEQGRTGMSFHYHVLIAGLREFHAPEREEWMRRWYKLGGDARIDGYKAGCGGVRYILKTVGPRNTDRIEFHLVSTTQLQSEFGGNGERTS